MSSDEQPTSSPRLVTRAEALVVGRYVLAAKLARGGLATVYLGRLLGEGGLCRTVAIKRMHAQFRADAEFTAMFLDEARLALRVRHPNVVPAIDVIAHGDELFLVMEYVEGVPLAHLMNATSGGETRRMPRAIVSSVTCGVLHGLHAAHETKDELGRPLAIVHRDVSPSNVIVGADGIARVLDFGIAKAAGQAHVTRDGVIKGKLAYLAPECVTGQVLTRRADVFATGIMLWEMLTGRRLFFGSSEASIVERVLRMEITAPSQIDPTIAPELDQVVLRALERDEARRFATAEEMAIALEKALAPASGRQVGEWVREAGSEHLASNAALVASVEGSSAAPSSSRLELVTRAQASAAWAGRRRTRAPRAAVLAGCALAVGAALGYGACRASSRPEVAPLASPPVIPAVATALAIPPVGGRGSGSTTQQAPYAAVSAAAMLVARPPSAASSATVTASSSGNRRRVAPARREAPAASARLYTRD